jgi:twitching motility protein PilU
VIGPFGKPKPAPVGTPSPAPAQPASAGGAPAANRMPIIPTSSAAQPRPTPAASTPAAPAAARPAPTGSAPAARAADVIPVPRKVAVGGTASAAAPVRKIGAASGQSAPYTLVELFRAMAEQEASDLYVKVGAPPMFRVSGVVQASWFSPPSREAAEKLTSEAMTERQLQRLEEVGHVDFAYWDQSIGRFRVNVYLQRGAVALAARRVKREIPTFEALHLPPVVGELALAPRGLVLVTGPAGSGKSTSLAAMVDHRNRNAAGHIITIEDPIEFLHQDQLSLVSQREVGTDTPSFAVALQAALRQTPDLLLIGEMRDADSATSAVHFAETGHLVLSTLHTINANSALDRVMHFFPPDTHAEVQLRLSMTLVGIIAQRLVSRADQGGLVPGVEVLRATPRVRELIRRGELLHLREAMVEGAAVGMQTFDDSFFALYQEGLISAETALDAAESPNDLRMRLRGFAPSGRRQA